MLPFKRIAISPEWSSIVLNLNTTNWINWAETAVLKQADALMIRNQEIPHFLMPELNRNFPNVPVLVNLEEEIIYSYVKGFHHKSAIQKKTLNFYKDHHYWVGKSCHSIAEVIESHEKGYDYVFLSPIYPVIYPKSTPVTPLGIAYLKKVCATVNIPVFALGGISHQNENEVIQAGAYGWAGIGSFLGDK